MVEWQSLFSPSTCGRTLVMDKETRDFLITKFEASDGKFDQIQEHIDSKAAESRRHFEVVAEGLRSDIQQIAEGHRLLLERQDRLEGRMTEQTEQVIRELGAMIKFSHSDLDLRIRNLEETVSMLQSRVEHIESRLE